MTVPVQQLKLGQNRVMQQGSDLKLTHIRMAEIEINKSKKKQQVYSQSLNEEE